MASDNRHIISRLTWDTSFDDKEYAIDLQNDLSTWSHQSMPGIIDSILDTLCPSEQTWKIKSLELDLGAIFYNTLKQDLSKNLQIQLTDALRDIVLFQDKAGNNIEILNKEANQIQCLQHFLLYGFFPWNYDVKHGSVNRILANALQIEPKDAIRMLEQIISHSIVRKRIVWQMTNHNIQTIIKGLEPNNYGHIISVHEQLIAIHSSPNVVQVRARGLKKSLWFWIFESLFKERETLFNKVAFLESSLRKMANHYNLDYSELYRMIDASLSDNTIRTRISSDFILTFKMIPENQPSILEKSEFEKEQELWQVFENQLLKRELHNTNLKIPNTNDLIAYLLNKDQKRVIKTIKVHGKSHALWTFLTQRVRGNVLEAIFQAAAPTQSRSLIESIHFLDEFHRENNIPVNAKQLWNIGLEFLFDHISSNLKAQDFINYSIRKVSQGGRVSTNSYLENLLNANLRPSIKTINNISIYNALVSVTLNESLGRRSIVNKNGFNALVASLIQQYGSGDLHTLNFLSQQKLFASWIRLRPTDTFNILVSHPEKQKLQELLKHVIDEHDARFLIQKERKDLFNILSTIYKGITNKGIGVHENRHHIVLDGFMSFALRVFIGNPQLSISNYIEIFLSDLLEELNFSRSNEPFLLRNAIFTSNQNLLHQLSIPIDFDFIEERLEKRRRPLIDIILGVISRSTNSKIEVSRLLMLDDRYYPRHHQKLLKHKKGNMILGYLMPNARVLVNKIIEKFFSASEGKMSKESVKATYQSIVHITWKCIIDYPQHLGNEYHFSNAVENTIAIQFPELIGSRPKTRDLNKANQVKLLNNLNNNEEYLSISQLFILIEKGLIKGIDIIETNDSSFSLSELLKLGLEASPDRMLKIITDFVFTKEDIDLLHSSILLEDFVIDMASVLPIETGESLYSIKLMLHLVKKVVTDRQLETLISEYWKCALKIIKPSNKSDSSIESLVRLSWKTLSEKDGGIDQEFIRGIQENEARLPHKLKCVLSAINPFLKDLIPSVKKRPSVALFKGINNNDLENLCFHIIKYHSLPCWVSSAKNNDTRTVIRDMVVHYPLALFKVLKNKCTTELVLSRLQQIIDLDHILLAIETLLPEHERECRYVYEVANIMDEIDLGEVTNEDVQNLIYKKVLNVWTSNTWKCLSSEHILSELVWVLSTQRGLSERKVLKAIKKRETLLPPALKISLDRILGPDGEVSISAKTFHTSRPTALTAIPDAAQLKNTGISISNAGLVLVNNYIPRLLGRLGFFEDNRFKTKEHQQDSVHYLQFLVTGSSFTEEAFLPLNKVLCGLHPTNPVPDGIGLSQDHKDMIHGLIEAVGQHWERIGGTSIDGFRGNWLVRNGILKELEDRWELAVEKRAYDLLLNESPFSFSIIKFPWMDKPLHVRWDY